MNEIDPRAVLGRMLGGIDEDLKALEITGPRAPADHRRGRHRAPAKLRARPEAPAELGSVKATRRDSIGDGYQAG